MSTSQLPSAHLDWNHLHLPQQALLTVPNKRGKSRSNSQITERVEGLGFRAVVVAVFVVIFVRSRPHTSRSSGSHCRIGSGAAAAAGAAALGSLAVVMLVVVAVVAVVAVVVVIMLAVVAIRVAFLILLLLLVLGHFEKQPYSRVHMRVDPHLRTLQKEHPAA